MTSANRYTDQDFELLSAYLDNELGISQRAALEMRLATDPALAETLDDLRHTIQVVHSVPRVIPPRNYTLDPAHYRRSVAWWARFRTLQLVGAFGSAAATVLIVLGLALTGLTASAPQSAPAVANVAIQPTSTLEFDNLADKTKADTGNEEPTQLLKSTTVTSESSAENAAASGFAVSTLLPPSPTVLPTQQAAYAATQGPMLPPAAAGSNGSAPTQNAPHTSAPNGNALSGAAEPFPALPSSSPAYAADMGAQSSAPSNPVGLSTATTLPTATAQPSIASSPTETSAAAEKQSTAMAKAARDNVTAAIVPTVSNPSAEQQGQDSATSNISKNNNLQSASTLSLPQILIIAGAALLVFSGILAGIGALMARTGRKR